jgi:hypothetical protein
MSIRSTDARNLAKEGTDFVALTVVPTKSFATVGGMIEINLIALTNGATRRKEVIDANIPRKDARQPGER